MIDWAITASWAQAVANTVVLFLIYLQMKQVNLQMTQNDEQERWRRSWEFIKFYREELREYDKRLERYAEQGIDAAGEAVESDCYKCYLRNYYEPRIPLFILLNQLIQHQEVDERMLFGYLSDEFNRFIELGVSSSNTTEFRKTFGSRMDILITLWGTLIKSKHLLYTSPTQSGTRITPLP